MSETKEDIPIFSDKPRTKKAKAKIFKVPESQNAKETVKPIQSQVVSNEIVKKVTLIQAILLITIAATIWLYLKNSDLVNIVNKQSVIIKNQSDKLQSFDQMEKSLRDELKSLHQNMALMKNRQESVEKYTLKSINQKSGESVVEENMRKSQEIEKTKSTLATIVKENEKLLAINSEINENNKMLHSEHQKLLEKFMDLVKTFDPQCKTGKCLSANELKVKELVNKDGEISESALKLYRAKALLRESEESGAAAMLKKLASTLPHDIEDYEKSTDGARPNKQLKKHSKTNSSEDW